MKRKKIVAYKNWEKKIITWHALMDSCLNEMERDMRIFFFSFILIVSGNCCNLWKPKIRMSYIIYSKQRKLNIPISGKLKSNCLSINSKNPTRSSFYRSFSSSLVFRSHSSFFLPWDKLQRREKKEQNKNKLRKVISFSLRWCPQMMIAAYQTNKFSCLFHITHRVFPRIF